MNTVINKEVENAKRIMVIQAENPDGDSIGSAIALEEILGEMGKEVSLYCPVEVPKYLRYIKGWDRITASFDSGSDLAIIVDTQANILLSKVYEVPGARHYLETHPVIVLDHHDTTADLDFTYHLLCQPLAATSQVIYNLATANKWPINTYAAESLMVALLSDTLGLTTESADADTLLVAAQLAKLGASIATIEGRRREFMKKSAEILKYKGELIERIEYDLDNQLALIHIPWEEIQKYSDQYNPSVLVLDEMRLVQDVQVALAIKTYPDGKLTGKIRTNLPIADDIAGFFGGGGHKYAAGFRIYQDYDTTFTEILTATRKALEAYDATVV